MFEGLNSLYSSLPYFTEEDYDKYENYLAPAVVEMLNEGEVSQYGSIKFSWDEFESLPDQLYNFMKLYGRVVYNKNPMLLENYDNLGKLELDPQNFDIFSRGKPYYFLDVNKNERGEMSYSAQDFKYDILYLSNLLNNVKKIKFDSDKLKKKIELSIADHILNLGVWLPYITLNAMAFSRHKKKVPLYNKTLADLIGYEDNKHKNGYVRFESDLKYAIKFGELTSDLFVNILIGKEDYDASSLEDILKKIDLEGIIETYPKYRMREGDNNFENYLHAINVLNKLQNSDSKEIFDKVASILWSGATVGSILNSLLNLKGFNVDWSLVKYSSHEPYLIKNLGKSLNEDLDSLVKVMYNPKEVSSYFEKQIEALERFYLKQFSNSKGVILADDVLGTGRTFYLSYKLIALCGVSRIYPTSVELSPHALDNIGSAKFINQKGEEQVMMSYFGMKSLHYPPSFKHTSNRTKSLIYKKIGKQEVTIGDIESKMN